MAAPVITVDNFGAFTPFCIVFPKDDGSECREDDVVYMFNRHQAPVSLADFNMLWAYGTPSTYGTSDGTRVLDTEFRASREITEVLLNTYFVDAVLAKIKATWSTVQRLQFHKLLMYDERGGFGLHVDQRRHPEMTHTVIVNVPVEGGNEYEFVRSTSSIRKDDVVNIVGFVYNTPHAVRMIRGKRICLVFHAMSPAPDVPPTDPFAFGDPRSHPDSVQLRERFQLAHPTNPFLNQPPPIDPFGAIHFHGSNPQQSSANPQGHLRFPGLHTSGDPSKCVCQGVFPEFGIPTPARPAASFEFGIPAPARPAASFEFGIPAPVQSANTGFGAPASPVSSWKLD